MKKVSEKVSFFHEQLFHGESRGCLEFRDALSKVAFHTGGNAPGKMLLIKLYPTGYKPEG